MSPARGTYRPFNPSIPLKKRRLKGHLEHAFWDPMATVEENLIHRLISLIGDLSDSEHKLRSLMKGCERGKPKPELDRRSSLLTFALSVIREEIDELKQTIEQIDTASEEKLSLLSLSEAVMEELFRYYHLHPETEGRPGNVIELLNFVQARTYVLEGRQKETYDPEVDLEDVAELSGDR